MKVRDREGSRRARTPSSPEQKAWYWYDWANSAYFTTILTVLFGPYMIAIVENAAPDCGTPGCVETLERPRCQRGGRVAGRLPRHLLDPARSPGAARGRGHRRPLAPQAAPHGRLRVDRVDLRRQPLPDDGRQLADRRRGHRRQQHHGRLLPGLLLRAAGRHLHRGGARPGLVARLGLRLPRRRPAAGPQPRARAGPRAVRAQPGPRGADRHAERRRSGGAASPSSRSCA